MKKKISVVIPIYNCKKYLKRCLDSVIKQSYKNLEILLIDDGSTDGSADICDEYAKREPRIKVFHRENSGVSNARNFGIKVASGDYLAFVDSDDVIELSMYEKLLTKAIDTDADMTFCDFDTLGKDGIAIKRESSFGKFLQTGDFSLFILANPSDLIMGSVWRILFKRDYISSVVFNGNIILGEDLIFVLQALSKTQRVSYVNEALYHYYFFGEVNYLKYINRKEYFSSQQILIEELVRILTECEYSDLAKAKMFDTYASMFKMILKCEDWKERLDAIPNKAFWQKLNCKENYVAFKKHCKYLRFRQKVANFLMFHNLFLLYRLF